MLAGTSWVYHWMFWKDVGHRYLRTVLQVICFPIACVSTSCSLVPCSLCWTEFRKMIKSCWHVETQKRPTMEEVLSFLDSLIGNRGGNDLEGAPGLHV